MRGLNRLAVLLTRLLWIAVKTENQRPSERHRKTAVERMRRFQITWSSMDTQLWPYSSHHSALLFRPKTLRGPLERAEAVFKLTRSLMGGLHSALTYITKALGCSVSCVVRPVDDPSHQAQQGLHWRFKCHFVRLKVFIRIWGKVLILSLNIHTTFLN